MPFVSGKEPLLVRAIFWARVRRAHHASSASACETFSALSTPLWRRIISLRGLVITWLSRVRSYRGGGAASLKQWRCVLGASDFRAAQKHNRGNRDDDTEPAHGRRRTANGNNQAEDHSGEQAAEVRCIE